MTSACREPFEPREPEKTEAEGDDKASAACQRHAMRTTHDEVSVRLYHLADGPDGGAANTLFYGPLYRALQIAAEQPEVMQDGLFIATDNDVVAYLDLIDP